MQKPPIPQHESERLKELDSYHVLYSLPEIEYDDITSIASEICQTPVSLITLIDKEKQWFKSHHGTKVSESPRELSFCAHAINEPRKITQIPDARIDKRFSDNPFVTGDAHMVFYAGAPLVTSGGHALGTLCVIDTKPKKLTAKQKKALESLSNQVVQLLELRRVKTQLESLNDVLETKNDDLEQFARIAAHDLKSPLSTMTMIIDIVKDDYGSTLDTDVQDYFMQIQDSSVRLKELIDAILEQSRSRDLLSKDHEDIKLYDLLQEIIKLQTNTEDCTFNCKTCKHTIHTNKLALQQILMNLISNAIKYCDKKKIVIEVTYSETPKLYVVSVKDNGKGIAKKYHKEIFKTFVKLEGQDRFGNAGTGIGLSTVNNLVLGLGGEITIKSVIGKGTTFICSIPK